MKKSVPQIRFQGFNEEWEEEKLNNIAEIVSGGTPSTDIDEYWNGDINWYSPAELGQQIFLKESNRKITKLGLQKSSAKLLPAFKTVLFTSRAGIGNMGILATPAATNQGFQSLVLKDDIIPYFIFSMGFIIKKKAEEVAGGSTFLEISGKKLGLLNIAIASSQEQTKIGSFFEKIDTLLSQKQAKLVKLQNLKKALLEKMFPNEGENIPQIRFKGVNKEWEKKQFENIFIFLQNNTLSRASLSNKGLAKNIHYGDILVKFREVVNVAQEKFPMIADSQFINKYKLSFLQSGDVIISDTAEDETVGKCIELQGINSEIVLSGLHTVPCRPVIEFAHYYLGYYINANSYHNQLLPLMQGIKVTSISKGALKNTIIKYPTELSEQTKIGSFFEKLDNLIQLQQKEIEKLQNIKKALLEKMFV